MKTLYLVRHAQAVPRQTHLPDPRRPLMKKGEKSAASMAGKMKKIGMTADVWISSTANRAVETAHIFAKVMDRSVHKILLKESVYSAEKPEILAVLINGLKNKHKSAIIFGHNPLLSDLASYYVKDFEQSLSKSGLAAIEFDSETWKDIAGGSGRLILLDFPGKDTELYDQMRRDLRNHLQRELTGILARLDEPAAAKSKKLIKETSRSLSKSFLKTIRRQRIKEGGKSRPERLPLASTAGEKTQDPSTRTKTRPEGTGPKKGPEKHVSTDHIIAEPKEAAANSVKKATTESAVKPLRKIRPAARKSPQKKSALKPAAEATPADGSKSVSSAPKRRPGRPRKAPTGKKTQAAAGGKASSDKPSPKKTAAPKKRTQTSRPVKPRPDRSGEQADAKKTDNPRSRPKKS